MLLSWTATAGSQAVGATDVYVHPRSVTAGTNTLLLANTTGTSMATAGSNFHSTACDGGPAAPQFEIVAKTTAAPARSWPSQSASLWTTRFLPSVWQEDGLANGESGGPLTVAKSGTWGTSSCTCFNAGRTMQTSSLGASVTYTVQTSNPGQYVAVVVAKAANRGRATITVDGAGAGTIDTYAATTTNRVIGWQTRLTTAGTHTIKITNQATAGRPRIDIDSVLLSPHTGYASEPDS